MKHIVIISESSSFPWGMAATSRVKLIARGLMHKGYDVKYIGLRGADVDYSGDKKRKGQIEGINYSYPGCFSVRSKFWIFRRLDDILGKLFSIMLLTNLKLHLKIDFIILYTRNYFVVKYWSTVAKILNIKIILELCEWPIIIANTANSSLFCSKAPLLVHGILPISEYIEKEVRKITLRKERNIPSYKIPILIDSGKFPEKHDKKTPPDQLYMLYSGSLSYLSILALIFDTMVMLKKDGYRYKLLITGGGNEQKYIEIFNQVKEKKIDDLVEFTGYLEEDVMIEKILNASVLLAPIPNDLHTESRFPTKLGFYLASGTPVITNPFGEIRNYLTDNENVLFIEDFNAKLLEEKIIYAFKNEEKCRLIGENARNLAFREFDYRVTFDDFKSFIRQL
jgi:glycosyltransferase involved in cell wall biosynthesis